MKHVSVDYRIVTVYHSFLGSAVALPFLPASILRNRSAKRQLTF